MSLHQGGSDLRGETLKSSFGDAAFSRLLSKASVVRWVPNLKQQIHCVKINFDIIVLRRMQQALISADSLNDGPAPDRWNES